MDSSELIRQLAGYNNASNLSPWSHQGNDMSHGMGPIFYDDQETAAAQSSDSPESAELGTPTNWFYTVCFIMFFFIIVCVALLSKDGIPWCCKQLFPHYSQHPLGMRGGIMPLDEEAIRQQQLEKQRQERRLWYSIYLKPHLTVLTAEHFMTDDKKDSEDRHEMEETSEASQVSDCKCRTTPAETDVDNGAGLLADTSADTRQLPEASGDDAAQISDMIDVDNLPKSELPTDETDVETGLVRDEPAITSANDASTSDLICQPVGTTIPGDEAPIKWMTLWDAHDTTFRKMEANCCICMLDYEEGDTIVRSAANEEEEYCIHVFHLECMLQWLSQGKKRCPICRHWFVPAVPIKEQMKEAHVVTRENSLHHLYDARTMQDITSLSGETDSNMSHSFNGDDHDMVDVELGQPPQRQNSSETLSDNVLDAAPAHRAGVRPHTDHPHHSHRHTPLDRRYARYAHRTAHVARSARIYTA